MNRTVQTLKYVVFDWLSASAAWGLFYVYRKLKLENTSYDLNLPLEFDVNFYKGLVVIPFLWLTFYTVNGYYNDVYRKSRLKELSQTLFQTVIGSIVLFFLLLLDDQISSYVNYYYSLLAIIVLHFGITFFFRIILTSQTVYRVQHRIMGFNTIIVGSNEKAQQLYNEMMSQPKSYGNRFVGFLSVDQKNNYLLSENLPHLGDWKEVSDVIKKYNIEEVVLAIESSEHNKIGKIVNELEMHDVIIKMIPGMYDILSGSVKMSAIFDAPLILISHEILPQWQIVVKRLFDVITALGIIIVFFPVYLITAIIVKLSSPGPIIYKQERIGHHGKPFFIYKFRSMYVDAESKGPALSSLNDDRITPFGSFMRKIRLDEMPQFFNVLKGEMSVVGPRPERQFYIDQIVERAPHYNHLLKVRPGITSWGQVKYGYAENVDQMVERLKYDILYIENMSMMVDFKILIYTIIIVLQGRGK